jgi:hypothetical protein
MPNIGERNITPDIENSYPEVPLYKGNRNETSGYYADNVLSIPGSIAPQRGLPPAEFTSDADTRLFFPYSAYTRNRETLNVNTYIRNLALQALEKAFGQPII